MSIQWTLAAGFLYAEMFLVLLLIFRFSTKRYSDFFKSKFIRSLGRRGQWYFAVTLIIMVFLCLDAIKDIKKYSNIEKSDQSMSSEMQNNLRLFRAQRNLYISGFALFLSLVIRHLLKLISNEARLMAEVEALLRQAKSATAAARGVVLSRTGEDTQNTNNVNHQEEVEKLTKDIDDLQTVLSTVKKDKETLNTKFKSLENEYHKLQEEHRKIQIKFKVTVSDNDKKTE